MVFGTNAAQRLLRTPVAAAASSTAPVLIHSV